MKYLNVLLVLFLISTSAKSQNSNQISLNNSISFETVKIMAQKMNSTTLDLSLTEGSPYFDDSFQKASLNIKNIEDQNQIWLRYNGYNDEIEIGKSKQQLSSDEALLKRKDIRASFDNKTYQFKNFITKKGLTIEGYLVILFEGKQYSVFRQDKKKLSEGRKANGPLESDIKPRFSDIRSYYLSNDNEIINEISLKLKNIIPHILEEDLPKIQKIKGEFKKIKTEEKLIKLFQTLER
jgi:hypothetical protein